LLVVTQHGLFDMGSHEVLDMSYLAETVVLLRHFEADGAVHKAISVVKKRYGAHEHTIRELVINTQGVQVGPPLTAFRGVLTGSPEYTGREGTNEHAR
jgi:circadian clock protein KaiC